MLLDDTITDQLARSDSIRHAQSAGDIRRNFALTSILDRYNRYVGPAEPGGDADQFLQDATDFDVVLMDFMMPELDGLDTTRAIRNIPNLKDLPIIAVTANARRVIGKSASKPAIGITCPNQSTLNKCSLCCESGYGGNYDARWQVQSGA